MNRNFHKGPVAEGAGASPPSEAWLFAQALLGKPVPSPFRAEADAQARREHLEWLAQISPEDARRVRGRLSEEADARAQRKQLEWLAAISTEHEVKLRRLLRAEAEASDAREHWEWLAEVSAVREGNWDPSQHPRAPKGQPDGGQWVAKGGSGSTSRKPDRAAADGKPRVVDQHSAPPEMLELANAWWQTNSLLRQCRRDIEKLPARIASEQAKLASGDGHSNVHWQNLAKAQRDLEHAQALVPQLEKQLHDLQQEYHDSGYDEVVYSTWTPGETLIGGRGIEQVGSAVDLGGSPAGLKPTGIEIDIALAASSVLQLGKLALGKALGKAPGGIAALTGQQHHAISKPVYDALEDSPALRGQYRLRDPRFATQAKDLASHKGYQQWHRGLDQEVRRWLENNRKATPAQFEKWLKQRYSQKDLRSRFPKGFGGGK